MTRSTTALRALFATLFVALLIPTPASADVRGWNLMCGSGALGCISWNLRLEYDPNANINGFTGGQTRLSASVTNRQGTEGFTDVGRATGAMGFTVSDLSWNRAQFGSAIYLDDHKTPVFSPHGNAGVVSSEAPHKIRVDQSGGVWETYTWGYSEGRVSLAVAEFVGGTSSVFGCDGPEDFSAPENQNWYSTCGGTLTLNWTFLGELEFTDETTVRSIARFTDGSEIREPTLVVPEPGAYLLILTSMFGFGLVVYRRREELT